MLRLTLLQDRCAFVTHARHPVRGRWFWLGGLLAVALTCPPGVWSQATTTSDAFDTLYAPLLSAHCVECHQGAEPAGGLDLTRRDAILRGGESGPAVVVGDAASSHLFQRVAHREMPPKHPLSDQQQDVLAKWINDGFPWSAAVIDRFEHTSSSRAGRDWWAFQPLKATTLPGDANEAIDWFVRDALPAQHLSPSPPASPRDLLRRVYFDLIGLPPTAETLRQFEQDPSPQAYAAIVDELLASRSYAERWGRHWLDVVRFGESDGFERNAPRDHAWPYRDWVIAALDRDLPYDEFVRQQLAGDLLNPGAQGAAAAGFLTAGLHNTVVGASERMKRLARQDELEEVVGTIGQTFLGLTVNCARCHDHKFDPISSTEYYQLIAAIDGMNHGEAEIPAPEVVAELAAVDGQIAQQQQALRSLSDAARQTVLAHRRESAAPAAPAVAPPLAHWDFETDNDDADHHLAGQPVGTARLEQGALVLDGQTGYVRSANGQQTLREKTLVARVQLDRLDQQGGAAISVQTLDGNAFDAIVFGEQEPQRWMAGSDSFQRTRSFQGPAEDLADQQPVHIAITYALDGTVTAYRNGAPYGQPYRTQRRDFAAGDWQVLFGLRHGVPTGNRLLHGRILACELYDRALSADDVAAIAQHDGQWVPVAALKAALSAEALRRYEQLEHELEQLATRRAELAARASDKIYTVRPTQPEPMRVHRRGSATDFGDTVAPRGLLALATVDADFHLSPTATDEDRRRQLAQWITHPDNPLLSRVMVNRVWHYHFGRGLVDTPSDFGFNGGRPSHPELLDWLAQSFRANGYHLKPLHRLIVLSQTYCQSSAPRSDAVAIDADNRWLWRMNPRRLEAEDLRDAILAISGQLNRQGGGPGFRDVSVIYNDGTTYYEFMDPQGPEFNRRTVYRFTPRGGHNSLLETFDCPDPSSSAPKRSMTTTPLQSLSLLNNSFVLRMADTAAAQIEQQVPATNASPDETRCASVHLAWLRSLGRSPDAQELAWSLDLVQQRGLNSLVRALWNTNEFVIVP